VKIEKTFIMTDALKPPRKRNLLNEMVSPLYMTGIAKSLLPIGQKTKGDHPVTVIPGFGANDASMWPLRHFLNKQGYAAEGWGLGLNLGGRGQIDSLHALSENWEVDRDHPHNGEGEVPYLVDQMRVRVEARAEKLGRAISLVGWSLGGYIAREVARDLPEQVDCVITMGSPVVGGPKYTRTAKLFEKRNFDLDWLESETVRRFDKPITQPITAIYSKGDGVVAWQAAQDPYSENVTHIEVACSHMALGVNAKVMTHVLAALEKVKPS
jgi:pimeloyl-ACP methyl ester carboxylesterase